VSVSAVIPVKDGERYLQELLEALAREGIGEILVIDSGSRDASLAIARTAGVRVLEIEPREFGHGRTRNLGMRSTGGDLICFLTQDATPAPGWLAAYREAFALDPRVGAAYGPHLPRPGTSPMIARELEEFFAGFSPGGEPVIQRAGDPTFLSNVNACYARACLEEIGFRDVPYSEDQAFGADMLAAGWLKVYQPRAGVLHAHDYGALEFMRRYFDEYRGLRQSTGHVEPFGGLATARYVRGQVAGDRRWMAERGLSASERARWTARAVTHHSSRRVFSALGSRAERVPAPLRRRLSLEGRDDADGGDENAGAGRESAGQHYGAGEARAARDSPTGAPAASPQTAPALPAPTPISPKRNHDDFQEVARVWREGTVPLLDPVPGMAARERLRIAMVIPSFRRGSGGHGTLMQILTRLEARGHVCSVWLHDFTGQHLAEWPAVVRADINEFFVPMRGPVYKDFSEWQGADVVIATGWQTVHPTLLLDQCRARVYLVNDHEPDFYPASVERELAADTYRHGLHCVAASPWLRDQLSARYDAPADAFQLGVDHSIYRPLDGLAREGDTVVYYARHATPRRAVPIGLMALSELHRRRPRTRIVLFGDPGVLESPFPYEHHGVLSPRQLARLYNEARVGLCLSLTNFSLMPKEMLACGLPCVELAGVSAESIFADSGALELAPLEPGAIADALERLLDDESLWRERSRAGIDFVASHTWDHAADEVEAGLRHALRERE
jgi:glycosyltransferase involved in cell wall biosynthesis/GT2 family glycosyltransferase